MKLLFDNGNGKILVEAAKWMKSSSEHLQNSGALIIGNLARSGIKMRFSLLVSAAVNCVEVLF